MNWHQKMRSIKNQIYDSIKMAKTSLQTAREKFTIYNHDLRMGREEWLIQHIHSIMRDIARARTEESKKARLRNAAIESVDQGVYSAKSPICSVEFSLVKRMNIITNNSWEELCEQVAPHFLRS